MLWYSKVMKYNHTQMRNQIGETPYNEPFIDTVLLNTHITSVQC